MKKWHLHEHELDIMDWRDDRIRDSYYFVSKEEEQQLRFLAYERWLNDRDLLTLEDAYEWVWTRSEWDTERSPSPDRPIHSKDLGLSRTKVER